MLVVFFGVLTPQVPAAEKTMVVSGSRVPSLYVARGWCHCRSGSRHLSIVKPGAWDSDWNTVSGKLGRGQNKARLGEIDGLVALYYSEERSQYYEYSILSAEDPVAIFVLSVAWVPFCELETLIGKKEYRPWEIFTEKNLTPSLKKTSPLRGSKQSKSVSQNWLIKKLNISFLLFIQDSTAASLYVMTKFSPISLCFSRSMVYSNFSQVSFVSLMPQIDAILKKLIEDQTIENLVSLHSQKWSKDWQL